MAVGVTRDRPRAGVWVVLVLVVIAGCDGVRSGSSTGTEAPGVTDTTTAERSPSPMATTSPTTIRKHPALDSVLYRLAQADNHTAFATEHGIELTDQGATVLLQLASGRELPGGFDLTVESRHEDLVRVQVPPDQLVSLAEHGNVSYIRRPPESNTDQ